MNKELPEVDILETRYRDLLQVALIEKILGSNSTTEQQNKWMSRKAQQVSRIIDGNSENSRKIRELARQEKYNDAADLLKELLQSTPK